MINYHISTFYTVDIYRLGIIYMRYKPRLNTYSILNYYSSFTTRTYDSRPFIIQYKISRDLRKLDCNVFTSTEFLVHCKDTIFFHFRWSVNSIQFS